MFSAYTVIAIQKRALVLRQFALLASRFCARSAGGKRSDAAGPAASGLRHGKAGQCQNRALPEAKRSPEEAKRSAYNDTRKIKGKMKGKKDEGKER